MISDKNLIINHTIFFAYFCHLIELDQVDSSEELCEIGWQLEEEIQRRKISEVQIEECIKDTNFEPQDQLMVSTYLYPDSNEFNVKIVHS